MPEVLAELAGLSRLVSDRDAAGLDRELREHC
jgi:hypothetical protein